MTREQRRERDFWLGCAEAANRQIVFLCTTVVATGVNVAARLALIDRFRHDDSGVIWLMRGQTGCGPDYGYNSERVLAACFLAAMAELGE